MDGAKDVMGFQYADLAGCDDVESDSDSGDSSMKENTGRWTGVEHRLFLEGLEQHGKQWKKIAALIKTRTVVQIRTHAQKYFQKLAKAKQSGFEGEILMDGRSSFATTSKRKSSKRKSAGARDHGASSCVSTTSRRNITEDDDESDDDDDSNIGDEQQQEAAQSSNRLSINAQAASKTVGFPGSPSPTSITDLEVPFGVDIVQLSRSKPVTRQRSAIVAAATAATNDILRPHMPAPALPIHAPASVIVDVPTGEPQVDSSEHDLLLEQDALSWLVEAQESSLTLDGSTDVDTTSSTRDGSSVDADEFAMRAQQWNATQMQHQQFREPSLLQDPLRVDFYAHTAAPMDACANKRMRLSGNIFGCAPLVIEQPQSFTLELANDADPYSTMQHPPMSIQPPRKNTTPRALDYSHHSSHSHSVQPTYQHRQPAMHHMQYHHPSAAASTLSSPYYHGEHFCTETDAFRVSLDVDTFVSGFLDMRSA